MKIKNGKIVMGVLVIVFAVAYLIYSSMGTATASYSITVAQALSGQFEQNKFYRIDGNVDGKNATFDTSKDPVELKFTMYDQTALGQKLTVIFNDVKPDNFEEATSAVVEGKFNSDGTFQASKLMPKCPSKYETEQ